MIAASGLLTALECTKFVSGLGSVPTSLHEGVYSAPQTLQLIKGAILLRGEGGYTGGEKERRKGDERNERDQSPFRKFLDPPLFISLE